MNASRSLPNVKKPCKDCPFRTDSSRGWLGADGMTEILDSGSFVCHKKSHLQCAGHMLINGDSNIFVRAANRLRIPLELSGGDAIFNSRDECISHHKY